jgi:hypothetical protein
MGTKQLFRGRRRGLEDDRADAITLLDSVKCFGNTLTLVIDDNL